MPWPTDAYASPLAGMATSRPTHLVLRERQGGWTYRQWFEATCASRVALKQSRTAAGERVAVFGTGTLSHAAAMLAVLEEGAIIAPQPEHEPVEALVLRLRAVQAQVAWMSSSAPSAVHEAIRQAGLRVVSCPLDKVPSTDRTTTTPAVWPLSSAWMVLCTSGSTGAPRPVMLQGHQVLANAFAVASRLGSLPSDVWLAALPWHHVGGLMVLFRTVLLGTALELCQPFDAERAARLLDEGAISLAPLVPTMLDKILAVRADGPMPARLRAIVLGGAPTPSSLFARARAMSLPIATSWGMTETASQVATQTPYGGHAPEDVGPALPGVFIESTAMGALKVCGIMASGECETRDGGFLDDQGHVHVTGRLDDFLISGGENVAVEPIEALLREHPSIADAAVVGRRDAVWGERPVAYLVATSHSPTEQALPSHDALVAFCRERMASFQRPVQFVWQPALPRDALGKLRRHALRALCNDSAI